MQSGLLKFLFLNSISAKQKFNSHGLTQNADQDQQEFNRKNSNLDFEKYNKLMKMSVENNFDEEEIENAKALKEKTKNASANKNGEKIAVCVEGPSSRLYPETLRSIKQMIIDALGADVFAVVGYPPQEKNPKKKYFFSGAVYQEHQIREKLEPLGELTAVRIKPDFSFHEMINDFFSKVPNPDFWVDVKDFFIRRATCNSTDPDEILKNCHSTDFADPNQKKINTNLWNLHAKASCHRIISQQEQKTGSFYERIVFIRSDMLVGVSHPPLTLMDKNYVWIPETSDYSGFNDRQAVVPRAYFDNYFLRIKRIFDGDFEQYLRVTNFADDRKQLSMEFSLLLEFSSLAGTRDEIKVARHLPIASVACASQEELEQNQKDKDSDSNSHQELGQSEHVCGQNNLKYWEEYKQVQNLLLLYTQNWYWHETTRHAPGSRTLTRLPGPSPVLPNFHFKGDVDACFDDGPDDQIAYVFECFRNNKITKHFFHFCRTILLRFFLFSKKTQKRYSNWFGSYDPQSVRNFCCNDNCLAYDGETKCNFGGNLLCWNHPVFSFDVCCKKSPQLVLQPPPDFNFSIVEEHELGILRESRIQKNNLQKPKTKNVYGNLDDEDLFLENEIAYEFCQILDEESNLLSCIDILPQKERKSYVWKNYLFDQNKELFGEKNFCNDHWCVTQNSKEAKNDRVFSF